MNKKLTIGVVVVAAIGLGFLVKKLYDDGHLDEAEDALRKLASKSKRNLNNLIAAGENQMEYLGERADQAIRRGKQKLDNVVDDLR